MKLGEVLTVISIVVGIVSLVSFLQLSFNVELKDIFREVINYYRVIANHTIGLPAKIIGIELPQKLLDFWSLSFVGAGAYCRVPKIDQSRALRNSSFTSIRHWRVILFFIMGICGFGLVIFMWAFSPSIYVDDFWEKKQDLSRASAFNALIIVLGSVLYFVLNAFFPYIWGA